MEASDQRAPKPSVLYAFLPLVLAAAGILAYSNSLWGPFVFDDIPQIAENGRIRALWPVWFSMGWSIRPLVTFSFAVNYALGGLNVLGYHMVNVALHLASGLVLYGLIRRTLMIVPSPLARPLPVLSLEQKPDFGGLEGEGQDGGWLAQDSRGLAFVSALIWLVHPLNTQCVNYLVQRGELMMGLFCFLTLYCACRGLTSGEPHARKQSSGWFAAALAACFLGMLCKAVMAAVPVAVFLYDRIFFGKSVKEMFRRRGWFYAALASMWIVPVSLTANAPPIIQEWGVGWTIKGVTSWTYAMTQTQVVLHYLRLALWPAPLVFDYQWPVAVSFWEVWGSCAALGGLIFLSAIGLRRNPPLEFLGLWFFLFLAPSSSVIPLADPAFEYRMVVPLAGVVTLAVIAVWYFLRRALPSIALRRGVAILLSVAVTAALGTTTFCRNRDYQSAYSLWKDTVDKRPGNLRAHGRLAGALVDRGEWAAAKVHLALSLHLEPGGADVQYLLGVILAGKNNLGGAQAQFEKALRLNPRYVPAHNDLGAVLLEQGKMEDARNHMEEALRLDPDFAEAHNNLGTLLVREGRTGEAAVHYRSALRCNPKLTQARTNLDNL